MAAVGGLPGWSVAPPEQRPDQDEYWERLEGEAAPPSRKEEEQRRSPSFAHRVRRWTKRGEVACLPLTRVQWSSKAASLNAAIRTSPDLFSRSSGSLSIE
jgi:hypothetical protein